MGVGVRSAVAGLVVALLVGGLLLGASEVLVRLPVQASTSDPAGAGTVTVPTGVRWTYQLPDDQTLRDGDVVAAGSGAAVLLDDGVVALDGATGEVRWQYRRTGARATQVAASAGGEQLVVVFRSGAGSPRSSRIVVLDGRTGEVGADWVDEEDVADGSYLLDLTGRVLVSVDADTVTARSLSDRSVTWTWRAPSGCTPDPDRGLVAGVDTVLVSCTIATTDGVVLRVVGLDDRTGVQRWVHEVAVHAPPAQDGQDPVELDVPVVLSSGVDGTAVGVSWDAVGDANSLDRAFILAADDGRVLTDDAALQGATEVTAFDERATVTRTAGLDTPVFTQLPADGSAARSVPTVGEPCLVAGAADLGDDFVQLCYPDDGVTTDAWVTPWDGSAVRRVPVDLGPVTAELVSNDLLRLSGVLAVVVPGTDRVVGLG